MKKLRIGIVGVGSIARVAHICSYNGMEDVEIVAVSDIVPEKMNYDQIPATAKKYADYREMLEKESLDAVDICTPNDLHSEIAVYALEHGKHVFCEKPDAISFEERKRMSAAQEKSGKVLMVMRNNRHTAGSLYLKKAVEAGEFGEIYAGRCGWIRRRGIPGKGGWFTTKSRSGGGPLIDLGVHMLDLAIYLMGNPKAVAVSGSSDSSIVTELAECCSLELISPLMHDANTSAETLSNIAVKNFLMPSSLWILCSYYNLIYCTFIGLSY